MANGLLGMFQNPQQNQMQALLGQYYDPRQAAKQQLWGMVRGLGQGLMNQGPSKTPINFGTTLGSAVQGGIEGSDQAVGDYQQKALLGYKMAGEKRDEDWQAKERARKESGWASEDANAAQMNAYIAKLPLNEQMLARGNWEAYVKSKLEPQEPKRWAVGGDLVDASGNVVYDGQERPMNIGGSVFVPGTNEFINNPAQPKKALTGTVLRMKRESQDKIVTLENMVKNLKEAKNGVAGSYEGAWAGTRAALGAKLPDMLVPDKIAEPGKSATSINTQNILSLEAIKQMTESLKGATTEFELKKFETILSDPSVPASVKQQTIDRMMALAADQLALEQEKIAEIDGEQSGAQPTGEEIYDADGNRIQ